MIPLFQSLFQKLMTIVVYVVVLFLSSMFQSFSFSFSFFSFFSKSNSRLIRQGTPEAGIFLFDTEVFTYPGFIEFDEVNSTVLTFSATER
jgi:hypothetical protein